MNLTNVNCNNKPRLPSCTVLYFQYEKCVLGNDRVFPLAFHDFKGIEKEDDHGVLTGDVICALKGQMKEGYTVRPKHLHLS